jgi:hypothetical protein
MRALPAGAPRSKIIAVPAPVVYFFVLDVHVCTVGTEDVFVYFCKLCGEGIVIGVCCLAEYLYFGIDDGLAVVALEIEVAVTGVLHHKPCLALAGDDTYCLAKCAFEFNRGLFVDCFVCSC